eukprot:scaffold248490_cov51-Cyclotella_meneghiniana.AAC.1
MVRRRQDYLLVKSEYHIIAYYGDGSALSPIVWNFVGQLAGKRQAAAAGSAWRIYLYVQLNKHNTTTPAHIKTIVHNMWRMVDSAIPTARTVAAINVER